MVRNKSLKREEKLLKRLKPVSVVHDDDDDDYDCCVDSDYDVVVHVDDGLESVLTGTSDVVVFDAVESEIEDEDRTMMWMRM